MAYGYPYQTTYFNTNYVPPAPPGMQPMMQPQQMPQPMQQTPPCNVQWIYVNGYQGAREHIVQPGQTAWMMDNNDPIIYVKAVDNMGSASLRAFKLEEIGTQPSPAPAPTIDTSQFVTRDEFNALVNQLTAPANNANKGGEIK